jgi:hypothetical protein
MQSGATKVAGGGAGWFIETAVNSEASVGGSIPESAACSFLHKDIL